MNIRETVQNYWRASNPVVYFVSDETFQAQTGVERAIDDINEGRDPKNKIRLVLHDPLVGFHFGEFKIRGACGARAALSDLTTLVNPDGRALISLGDDWNPIEREEDCVVVLKGWEQFWTPREPLCSAFVQAFSNILQGNLCSAQWAKCEGRAVDSKLPKHQLDLDANTYIIRGRRMFVFICKHDQVPPDLSEIRPMHVPLPGAEEFVSLVETQWEKLAADPTAGFIAEMPDSDVFKRQVVSSLTGFPLSAGEDALMLSIVENRGFHPDGTLATIERLKAASIARVPGLQYVPRSCIDTASTILPGYEPVQAFVEESTAMDPDFAAAHNVKPIRGLLITGPPGVGKTVVSKQVARSLGKPLLMWSMGESQGSLVSESERNTRRVIDTGNAIGAVVGLDDADKAGLSTGRAANDGGVFDRMINILLTEMANPSCNITWIINGNRVQNIRPELYRDGRVDERFFVDLPDAPLREVILRYHIAKHNFPLEFQGLSVAASLEAMLDLASDGQAKKPRTSGWSGAELEGLVARAARNAAKTMSPKLDIRYMLHLAGVKTPQSQQVASKEDYLDMRNMCADFVQVGVSDAGKSLQASGPIRGTREAEIKR